MSENTWPLDQYSGPGGGREMLRGLLIKDPWIGMILKGSKKWEIRGSRTSIRGTIALIRSGSGLIVGVCDLVDVQGPLTLSELKRNIEKHRIPLSSLECNLPYKETYAWALSDVKSLKKPVPYKHARGAIIWVKLQKTTACKLVPGINGNRDTHIPKTQDTMRRF